MKTIKLIISGGGTGGHIFPAISIANAVRECCPDAEILFVGAEGRMEMQRVPAAGYRIEGLPVCGLYRKQVWKNLGVAVKFVQSALKARRIVRDFAPDVVVGVGGYASGPTLRMAAAMGVPTLLQEQNSYAGVTNKFLARSAKRICVAYEGMERFFDAGKLLLTGNPVRQGLATANISREAAIATFGLDPQKPTLLVLGGSLGARTLNESVLAHIETIGQSGVQVIWQSGKYYFEACRQRLSEAGNPQFVHLTDFIGQMETAYAAADLIISRAGAGSISEFSLLGKAGGLVPSPNVAEDHQTKNALALVEKGAAQYIKDSEAKEKLLPLAVRTIVQPELLATLRRQIATMARPNAAADIAREVIALASHKV